MEHHKLSAGALAAFGSWAAVNIIPINEWLEFVALCCGITASLLAIFAARKRK